MKRRIRFKFRPVTLLTFFAGIILLQLFILHGDILCLAQENAEEKAKVEKAAVPAPVAPQSEVAQAAAPVAAVPEKQTAAPTTVAPEKQPVAVEAAKEASLVPAPSVETAKKPEGEAAAATPLPAATEKTEKTDEKGAVAAAEEVAMVSPGNVTVNFKGADIRTVLSYIAEVSGVDIVPSPDVSGTVDLKLTNKPWKTALDIIIRNYGFAYEREGDIIRVVTVDRLKQEELATQTFSLNYGKAKDVVTSIKEIVSPRGKIMYDDRTNLLIVTDIPTNLYNISQIVEKVDKKTAQVLIEARIIETQLSNTEKLGIDWNVKFAVSGAKRPTTIPFEAFKTPFDTKSGEGEAYFPQVQTAATSSVNQSTGSTTTNTTTNTSDFPGTASGVFSFPFAAKDNFTFGTIDFSQFSMIAEALKQRVNTDIISNPRIATLDNNQAIINVGQTFNMPKFERSSTTGRMEITGYEPKDLGIILKVTPHINSKDEIVVDLSPEISEFLKFEPLDPATGIVAPVFESRIAKTQVRIKDGETIFIGGLIKENDIDVKHPVPIIGDLLGDVPGIGPLFCKKEKTKQKVELIFFITVKLISPDKELKDVPDSNKARVPMYVLTQEPDPAAKKNKKSRFGK